VLEETYRKKLADKERKLKKKMFKESMRAIPVIDYHPDDAVIAIADQQSINDLSAEFDPDLKERSDASQLLPAEPSNPSLSQALAQSPKKISKKKIKKENFTLTHNPVPSVQKNLPSLDEEDEENGMKKSRPSHVAVYSHEIRQLTKSKSSTRNKDSDGETSTTTVSSNLTSGNRSHGSTQRGDIVYQHVMQPFDEYLTMKEEQARAEVERVQKEKERQEEEQRFGKKKKKVVVKEEQEEEQDEGAHQSDLDKLGLSLGDPIPLNAYDEDDLAKAGFISGFEGSGGGVYGDGQDDGENYAAEGDHMY
jgi:hypothetical protein